MNESNRMLNISNLSCVYCLNDNNVPTFKRGYLFAILISFGVATVLGNSLIIVSVLKKRSLHTATNYFITSLAIADFLVGLVVMPFSATYEAMDQRWIFGPDWCDIWHSMDVLASTASILNLCVISLDRYWAITDPMTYPYKMTGKRAAILIVLVWVCSSVISFPAIAWWRLVAENVPPEWKCPFTEDMGYLIFSSTVSFYGPLTIMVFAYAKIYKAALEHTRSLKLGAKVLAATGGPDSTLRIHRGGGGRDNSQKSNNNDVHCTLVNRDKNSISFSKKIMKFSKEKKAAKTLGTVMGVFIICWLPFFITNIISGLCSDCIANPDFIIQVVTWLGWINSGMNPAIYAYCSKDFRSSKRSSQPPKFSPKYLR
nr:dopamine receptor 2-like [Lepeophtheirus salmonis]